VYFSHFEKILLAADLCETGEEQAMLYRGVKPPFYNARQGDPEPLSLHPVRSATLLSFNQGCRPGPAARLH